jgi:hypothetical protein
MNKYAYSSVITIAFLYPYKCRHCSVNANPHYNNVLPIELLGNYIIPKATREKRKRSRRKRRGRKKKDDSSYLITYDVENVPYDTRIYSGYNIIIPASLVNSMNLHNIEYASILLKYEKQE